MDRPRGDVRGLCGQPLPPNAQGPDPAPHHPQSRGGRRIPRHESLRKGEKKNPASFHFHRAIAAREICFAKI